MNVGVNFFGRLQLHNEINFRDVQTSSCHVSGHQAFQVASFKRLERDLSLLLRNVAVQYLSFLLEVGLNDDLVCFLFGLAENNGPSVSTAV